MRITRRQIRRLVEQILTQSDRKDMTYKQTAAIAEIMNAVGSDALLDIKHDDNNAVSLILSDDREITVWADDTQQWLQHGEFHRDDGPAVILPNGTQQWYQHGEFHRDNGPAMIYADGTQWWFQHSKRHREDGPAMIEANGTQYWWLNGKQVSEAEYARLTNKKNSR